ncbi:MAG TPA: cation transporting ATPase C-terminal domain-containing protein, partial [Terriglobales bacterium]|nr:cation transporting ATPase C-terminal domain-containing protein [Terriglobales bacterium]
FDFITFYVLLRVFHSNEAQFHTGWFVESLATQTLVLLVIRTTGNPLRNLPSRPLLAAIVIVVLTGIILPFSPLAGPLGFTPLPTAYFGFLAAATLTYLLLVQLAKRWLLPRAALSPA